MTKSTLSWVQMVVGFLVHVALICNRTLGVLIHINLFPNSPI